MKTCYRCKSTYPLSHYIDGEINRRLCCGCREIVRFRGLEKSRQWAKNNRERSREIKTKWRLSNPDQVKEIGQKYYLANSDKVKQSSKRWRSENVEHWALILKAGKHVREARKRAVPNFDISLKDIKRILNSPCAVRGCERTDIQIDHIVPLARGGSHGVGNLQPLCGHHNASKNAKLWIEFQVFLQKKTAFAA